MVDTISGGSQRPPWPPWRWAALGVLAVIVVGVLFSITRPDPAGRRSPEALPTPAAGASPASPASSASPAPSLASASSTQPTTTGHSADCDELGTQPRPIPDLDRVVALALASPAAAMAPSGALDRDDPTAVTGPWSVLLRTTEGSLSQDSAVLTFPIEPTADDSPGVVSDGPTTTSSGKIIWPIAGGYAQIRGDLPLTTLQEVMTGTRVIDGRPQVSPPPGVTVVASMPYRGEHLRELRYNGSTLGTGVLGGLVYTGLLRGGWFEDQLLTLGGRPCGTVGGRPAVVSTVLGGNGTLAWEYAPGVVGYLGYSGSDLTGSVLTVLREIAATARPLDQGQWAARTPQQVTERWSR